jgi:hypothetical protein
MDALLSKKLKEHHWPKANIEKTLGMPKNSLSGMINGTRPTPKKWEEKLCKFVVDTEIKVISSGPDWVIKVDEKTAEIMKDLMVNKGPGNSGPPHKYEYWDAEKKEVGLSDEPVSSTVTFRAPWIKKIEDYCGEIGMTPEDLIEDHRLAKKGFKGIIPTIMEELKKEEPKEEQKFAAKGMSKYDLERRLKKNGY